jgi:hypothetical protein
VIQSHFKHHGDEIYEEVKSIRTLTENALVIAQQSVGQAPDPVGKLAAAIGSCGAKSRVIKKRHRIN